MHVLNQLAARYGVARVERTCWMVAEVAFWVVVAYLVGVGVPRVVGTIALYTMIALPLVTVWWKRQFRRQ